MAEEKIMSDQLIVKKYPFYSTQHHKKSGGFKNIYGRQESPPILKAIKWLMGKIFDRGEKADTELRKIEKREYYESVNSYRVFWFGHSALLVQFRSTNILVDPNLNGYAGPGPFFGRKRLVDLPGSIADLPQIDVVVISHSHYDHLDKKSVIEINRRFNPVFLVPLGMDRIIKSWGVFNVVSMDWWQYGELRNTRISCVPAVHFSNRGPGDRDMTLWAGWYLEDVDSGVRIYYSGDTAYGEHFKEIGERLGPPDLAILPIGAYEPRWFMKLAHINPEEALKAFIDLKAKEFLGVHWGTFKLSDEPVDEPPVAIRKVAVEKGISGERIHILPVGGKMER